MQARIKRKYTPLIRDHTYYPTEEDVKLVLDAFRSAIVEGSTIEKCYRAGIKACCIAHQDRIYIFNAGMAVEIILESRKSILFGHCGDLIEGYIPHEKLTTKEPRPKRSLRGGKRGKRVVTPTSDIVRYAEVESVYKSSRGQGKYWVRIRYINGSLQKIGPFKHAEAAARTAEVTAAVQLAKTKATATATSATAVAA